jgi:hypothetical protein
MCSKIWRPENSPLFTSSITVVCKYKVLNEAGFSDCTLDESDNVTFFYFADGLNTTASVNKTMATTTTIMLVTVVTDAARMEAKIIGTWAILSASEPTQRTPSME